MIRAFDRFGFGGIGAIIFGLCLATLSGCGGGGGGGGGGTAGGFAAVSASIVPVSGRNAQNIINSASLADVTIAVDVGPNGRATDTITVTLSDGQGHTVTANGASVAGPGTAVLGPIDASSLSEGAITVDVIVHRGGTTEGSVFTNVGTKDIIAPAAPTSLSIAAGIANAIDVVNQSSVSAANVLIPFPANANGADLVSVFFTDGTHTFETIQQNVLPGATNAFTGIDLSAFTDGTLTIIAKLVDLADNSLDYTNAAVLKDTVLDAPTAVHVASGAQNAQDIVNSAVVSSVTINVDLPPAMLATDQTALSVTDGQGHTVQAASAAPQGGGTLTFGGLDLSAFFDGQFTMTVTNTDAAGNQQVLVGYATKDIRVSSVSSAHVAATAANAIDVINAATASTVQISVALIQPSVLGDSIFVSMSDGQTTVTQTTPIAAAQTTATVTIDVSTLADGPVTLSARVLDVAQNQGVANGTPATKDTVSPATQSAAVIAASGANAAGVINAATAASVVVDVTTLPDPDATRTLVVTLTSGATSVSSAPVLVPTAGGPLSVSGINASSLADGTITISFAYADQAGNTSAPANGTGTKDTIVGSATSAAVLAGGSNAANSINAANVASVNVQVVVNATAASGDLVELTLSDGVSSVLVQQIAPVGGGAMTFAGINASSLADGAIQVSARVFDASMNSHVLAGTPATKDTQAPTGATAVHVVAGAQNAQDVINATNAPTAQVAVTFPGGANASDTVTMTLTDGATVLSTMPVNVTPGATQTANFFAAFLFDGTLTLRAIVTDSAGNTTTITNAAIVKDTVLAVASAASVSAGAQNAANTITAASTGSVTVSVTMPVGSLSTDQVTVDLASGAVTVSSATQSAPFGGGVMTFSGIDASTLADGTINVIVRVADAAGNRTTFSGTQALKDATPPVGASSVSVAAGAGNAQNIINGNNVMSATIDIQFPAGASAADSVSATLTDGLTMVTTGSASVLPGGIVSFTVSAGALAEGSITVSAYVTDSHGNTTTTTATATKDTMAPAAPTAAHIAPSAFSAQDIINLASSSSVTFTVNFSSAADANATFVAALQSVSTGPIQVSPGATTIITSIDASSLADGAYTIVVTVTDAGGNQTTFNGATVTVDRTPPAAPTAAIVAADIGNAANVVNISNGSAATVRVTFSANADPADLGSVHLGATSIGSITPVASGTVDIQNVDATGIADGSYTVGVTLTDAVGNQTIFTGSTVLVDQTAPAEPTGLYVAAGGANAIHVVNVASAGAVVVTMDWPANANAADSATAILADGASSVTQSIAVTPSATTTAVIDASALADGVIVPAVYLSDAAGNSLIFTGTNAAKDTVPPTAPVMDPVLSPFGPMSQRITGIDAGAYAAGAVSSTTYVRVNGVDQAVSPETSGDSIGFFETMAALQVGTNTIEAFTVDQALNESTHVTADFLGNPLQIVQDAAKPQVFFSDQSAGAGILSTFALNTALADFDGDGAVDVFIGGQNRVYHNVSTPGTIGFVSQPQIDLGMLSHTQIASLAFDYDGDGDDDLMTAEGFSLHLFRNDSTPGTIVLVDVSVATLPAVSTSWDLKLYAFDFDSDGDTDVYVSLNDAGGTAYLLENLAGVSFTSNSSTFLTSGISDQTAAACADYDFDGDVDVLIGRNGTSGVFLDNTAGILAPLPNIFVGVDVMQPSGADVHWADFDGDGDLDVFVTNASSGHTELWINGGGMPLLVESASLAGASIANETSIAIADFDRDGLADKITTGAQTTLAMGIGDATGGDGIFEFSDLTVSAGVPTTDFTAVVAEDFDGDGATDILLHKSGSVSVLHNDLLGARQLNLRIAGATGVATNALGIAGRVSTTTASGVRNLGAFVNDCGRGIAGSRSNRHAVTLDPSRAYTINVHYPTGLSTTQLVPMSIGNFRNVLITN